MSDKSDHLIERAAALLRSASAARLPEQAEAGINPEFKPVPPPRPAARSEDPPGLPPGVPPLLVPPARPMPVHGGSPGATSVQTRPRPMPPPPMGGAASEIRPSETRPAIPLEALERAGLMVARNKRTRTAEEYRIVIGRVLRALHEEPEGEPRLPGSSSNLVMVTSARPGEGKSFTALNLAGSIAQNAGESVLLVDVDPKIRPMTDQLGLSENQGFMDLIAQPELAPEDLIVPTDLPNLAFLPLGRVNRRGGGGPRDESHNSVRPITPTLQRLAQRFQKSLVLLDAPPCLSTSDPHTLAPVVGQVVMVVEAERTQRNEVEAALDLVRVCPTVTMLLNKVRMSTSHTFGAYDYFGTYT
ncbi:MAG TPA: hypothetical protein VE650_09440 [Acetobacteraceae bacterium]|nr:hypothetical protein [Acetobacteraceae bacterium]